MYFHSLLYRLSSWYFHLKITRSRSRWIGARLGCCLHKPALRRQISLFPASEIFTNTTIKLIRYILWKGTKLTRRFLIKSTLLLFMLSLKVKQSLLKLYAYIKWCVIYYKTLQNHFWCFSSFTILKADKSSTFPNRTLSHISIHLSAT